MAKNKFMPSNLTEWLTAICLIAGITASVYGAVVKPYNSVRDIDTRLSKLESSIDNMRTSIDRLERKIWRFE